MIGPVAVSTSVISIFQAGLQDIPEERCKKIKRPNGLTLPLIVWMESYPAFLPPPEFT